MKKNNEVVRLDKSERIVKLVAYIAMGFCAIMAVLPCLNVIAQSFSMGTEVTAGRVTFWPRDFQLTSYKSVLQQSDFLRAMINSLLVTVIGTVVSLAVTVMFAYPLSQKNLYGKKFVTLLCIISMVFSGGTVPKYLVVRSLGLFNTLASLIIPSCFSVFDMLIVRNYFESLPDSVPEAASLDGASDIQILIRLILPMSIPSLATVGLLYAVGYWNSYFNAMLYITKPNLITLQVFMKNFIQDCGVLVDKIESTSSMIGVVSNGNIIACCTVLGVLPIVVFYPFVQKHLTKGMTIGSEKG